MKKQLKKSNLSLELDDMHPAQAQVYKERARFNVLSCGRRWGKTHLTYRLIADMVMYNLNNGFHEDMGYMSPTYKNLEPTWRKFVDMFEPLITSKSEQSHTAEIMDTFLIEFWSLDKPESIRGRQYKRIIIDEAALIHGLKSVFRLILLPTIGDLQGDAWFFSTPRGFNDFQHFYRLGQNPVFTEWASWIMPTSSNPYFPAAELKEQRALIDPSEYAQEWEGKFVALGNSPFDVTKFKQVADIESALSPDLDEHGQRIEQPLYHMRYWDIANSKDGDYTASSKLTVTNKPQFIISQPVRYKGLWGNNYPFIKQQLLMEPDILHIFETEGVGGIAWQMIQMDADLAHIQKMPAGKSFTNQSKEERAQLWAMELQNGRMTIVKGLNAEELMDEVASFPAGDHDDWVDGISGNFLAFIFFFGGYQKLLDAKKIHRHSTRPMQSYRKQQLIRKLQETY